MKIDILTLFPEMFAPMTASILGRAQKENKLRINVVNIRDYTEDKHLKCDDYPFGGGAGMVMTPQPIGSAIEALDPEHAARRIYLSPKGEVFRQQKVFELLEYEHLILLCGHYEGIDQRVIDLFIDEEISIGDYVGRCGLRRAVCGRGAQCRVSGAGELFGEQARIPAVHPPRGVPRDDRARSFAKRQPRRDRQMAPRTVGKAHEGEEAGYAVMFTKKVLKETKLFSVI